MKSIILSMIVSRHLYYRKFKHLYWSFEGNKFVRQKNDSNANTFPHLWATFECPVVNHPTQDHLLESKVFNMQLACEKLDGLIIPANSIFSFWRIIKNPSAASGFKSGPTFERGEIITSYGGGLCQISGILFNIAICSGLKILERHPHSIDAYGERRYLPLGRDATVAWKSKDLCFQNNTNIDLQLKIKASKEKTEAQFFAMSPLQKKVVINQFIQEDTITNGKTIRHAKITRIISEGDSNFEEDFGWNHYKAF
jgi:vancomycin resistance protein VanW